MRSVSTFDGLNINTNCLYRPIGWFESISTCRPMYQPFGRLECMSSGLDDNPPKVDTVFKATNIHRVKYN